VRQDKYLMKYGIIKHCGFCNSKFETKPRFLDYCSTSCKNPNNRPGHKVWNEGIKLTEEQKSKQDRSGLEKGRGWNKGKPNEISRKRFLENNPNKDGRVNNTRPKKIKPEGLSLYKSLVRYFTYRTIKELRKENKVPKLGKYKTDFQIDHIIPYKQGFELGILPYVLGGKENIRFILGSDNREKWDKYQDMEIVNKITGGYYVL
jgi:hypothetical protein